eukprot:EW705029.1.p2 GENE.EW705029.1~~EW705029.1.p2  ORF type:complete len:81 (-),score=1.85 EW705029.1:301-522(-)
MDPEGGDDGDTKKRTHRIARRKACVRATTTTRTDGTGGCARVYVRVQSQGTRMAEKGLKATQTVQQRDGNANK